jgi:hypothetical protein
MQDAEIDTADTSAVDRDAAWDALSAAREADAQPQEVIEVTQEPEANEADTSAETVESNQDQNQEADTSAEPEQDVDFWATVDPKIRAQHEAEKSKFEHKLKSEAGRIAAAEKALNETNHLRLKLSEFEAEKAAQIARHRAENVEKLEDFPEMQNVINDVRADFQGEIDSLKRQSIERENQLKQEREAYFESQTIRVNEAHPDLAGMDEETAQRFADELQRFSREHNTPENNFAQIFTDNNEVFVDAAGVNRLVSAYKQSLNPNNTKGNNAPVINSQNLDARRRSQIDGLKQPAPQVNTVLKEGYPDTGTREQLWDAGKARNNIT